MAGVILSGFQEHLLTQEDIQKRMRDLRPAMQRGLIFMVTNVIPKLFFSQMSPEGVRWQSLGPKTLARKMGRGRILFDRGDLQRSVTRGTVSKAGKDSVTIGTNLKYAATHQRGRGAIPKRRFVGYPKAALRELEKIVNRWIFKGKR